MAGGASFKLSPVSEGFDLANSTFLGELVLLLRVSIALT